jgi:hypothetical protein
MRSRHRRRRVAHTHRPMGQPCTIAWCMHGSLGVFDGSPSFEHCLLRGQPYVLYGVWVALSALFWPKAPHDLCHLARGRSAWLVCGTMNPSPSTDYQYIYFKRVFLYRAGAYVTGTKIRYLKPICSLLSESGVHTLCAILGSHLYAIFARMGRRSASTTPLQPWIVSTPSVGNGWPPSLHEAASMF